LLGLIDIYRDFAFESDGVSIDESKYGWILEAGSDGIPNGEEALSAFSPITNTMKYS